MNCPRCQGCLVKTREEEYCINCGHRTDFVPENGSVYGAYREDPKEVALKACLEQAKKKPAPKATPEQLRERRNARMREYSKTRRNDPKYKEYMRAVMKKNRLKKKRLALAE